MDNPTILHQLAFLYIAFAKISNNKLPISEEISIKKKIAKWMDLSYKNVGEYEMVMKQSLKWFNETPTKNKKESLLTVAHTISKDPLIDKEALEQILSEIRDISIADGKFEKGEKELHDQIASEFGFSISTIDEPDLHPPIGFKYNAKSKSKSKK